MDRQISPLDRAIGCIDQGLRLVFGPPPTADRPNPSRLFADASLGDSSKILAGRLMRVNHSGEICAQALYQGQALTARRSDIRKKLEQAAQEENDHLAWTSERIDELGSHTSHLNPLWYAGSFVIGAAAGLVGDRWSLGFLAETERQVVEHLEGHLSQLPVEDEKSREVVRQMRDDESRHATTAMEAGGAYLPPPIQTLMRLSAKIMTRTTYWF